MPPISGDLLFISIALIDLLAMLCFWRMGREWLELFIVMNCLFANLFVQKFTLVFGITTTISTCFYAAIFLGTDIITEHFGKKAGYRLIWKSFTAILVLALAQQLVLLLPHTPDTAVMAAAMQSLFETMPRIVLAGLVAFLTAQRFDIWFYHFIHDWTDGKHLWLRNIASTSVSQAFDTVIFCMIAFYGLMPADILIEVMLVAYGVKLIVAFLDTPFIYASYWIKKTSSQA